MNASKKIAAYAVLALTIWFPAGCRSGDTGIETLLPRAPEGWSVDGEDLRYEPENLWEYINGAAEHFLAYGFVEVAVRNYRSDAGKELKVEIYRHASPLMAFGIYSQLRSPDLTFLPIGAEGFGDPYSLHFWEDAYYVKVAVFEENEMLAEAMQQFASAVSGRIPGEGAFPAEIGCFPPEGMVAKSAAFIAEGVLGSDRFPPSFVAVYHAGERQGKLYLAPLKSDEEARKIFDWYAGTIGAPATAYDTPHGAIAAAEGSDRYRGETAIFVYGNWIGVFTGFGDDAGRREALMHEAVTRIARMSHGSKD
jgi:hypothetical protein